MKSNVRIYEDSQGMLVRNVPEEIFLVIDLLLSDVQETRRWIKIMDRSYMLIPEIRYSYN